MTYKIYGHKSPSNKWYIGQTSRLFRERWMNGKGYSKQPKFYRAIQKYGWENLHHIFIAECETEEQAILIEAIFKRIYDSVDNGYNTQRDESKNPMAGNHHTNETRKKMSDNHKDFSGSNNPKFGKTNSLETRQKISNALAGKPTWNKGIKGIVKASEETKAKMSAARKGKSLSIETRAKMSAAHKGNQYAKGAKRSEEQKKHYREAALRRWAKKFK